MSDLGVDLHHGGHHAGWMRRTVGKGVPEVNGELSTLLLFTESVALPGDTTGKNDTPPIPVRVHRDTKTELRGRIDRQYHLGEVVHLDVAI